MSVVVVKMPALITPADNDAESPNGAFEVILSAPTLDRDGETLDPDEWKQPLPDHITFDIDHGMSVATTVGSGKPEIDQDGRLLVRGTYSSIPRAQEVRTLVNEGHIKTTSVAFMRERNRKDGKTVRELLNGAFVAVPSNRDALVTSSKAFEAVEEKAGRRNSASDLAQIQMAHDAMVALGALCDGMGSTDDGDGSLDNGTPLTIGGKAPKKPHGNVTHADPGYQDDGKARYPLDTAAHVRAAWSYINQTDNQKPYTTEQVDQIKTRIQAAARRFGIQISKSAKAHMDPVALAQATDAALDEGIDLLDSVDISTLPENVAQAIGCFMAAGSAVDDLLDVMGADDPDDPDEKDVTSSADDSTADEAKGLTADDELALLAVRAHQMRARAAVI